MPTFPALNDLATTVTLNDGTQMPVLGLGTWQVKGQDCIDSVKAALDLGYRHIDTAAIYGNEKEVGQAIAEAGIARNELFVTTKLWNSAHGTGDAETALNASLDRLGLNHVDLYLIHWPVSMDFMDAWRGMETLLAEGKTKSIGVSNFLCDHLEKLMAEADTPPSVNQIEAHPWLQQADLLDCMHRHGIQPEAWSPLMQGKWTELTAADAIAEKHSRSVPQVVLRWLLQTGHVVIPKSTNPSHIEANAKLFDFALDDEDMHVLSACNRDERLGPDPHDFAWGTDFPVADPASGA